MNRCGMKPGRAFAVWLAGLLAWLWMGTALAGVLPEPLRPWKDWVLRDKPERDCPYYYNSGEERQCAWPSAVRLALGKRGGSFDYRVEVFRSLWVPLPGDGEHWPQNVKADGKPAAVTPRDERPGVTLEPGAHVLSGDFVWDEMPESLQLPEALALVSLTLEGKAVDTPKRDTDGSLWLQRQADKESGGDHLDIQVSRLLDDDIPFQVTTRLEVTVSGKNREATLPDVLLPGLTPLALKSDLPARLEPDGGLRLQLRPGRWEISLAARSTAPVAALSLPAGAPGLAAEEIWAFNAHNDLRVVTPQGDTPIDPKQTTLPEEWKPYPAFRIRPGETLKLAETKRGDPEPAPDDLRLARTIWLDFDGNGYTVQDHITGNIRRSWRLSMGAPALLGRAAIDDEAQFITTAGGAQGIEVRKGNVHIEADSRLESAARRFSATGWRQEFQHVSAVLNLPPGWGLFAVSGADEVSDSWVSQWTLLDFFVVLIASLAAGRLWGWRWGMLTLAALALSYHQQGAPRWAWLAALAAVALLKVLPAERRLRKALRLAFGAAMLAVAMILLPFVVAQVRQSLYPVLEPVGKKVYELEAPAAPAAPAPAAPAEPQAPPEVQAKLPMETAQVREMNRPAYAPPAEVVSSTSAPMPKQVTHTIVKSPYGLSLERLDPGAVVQTGPGLPNWWWHEYRLGWNGPVDGKQEIRLWLLPPAVNVALAALRIALLGLLFARLLGRGPGWPRLPRLPAGGARRGAAASAVMLAMLVALAASAVLPQAARAEEIPRDDMLSQLKEELSKAPECLPACADIPRMLVSAKGAALTVRLEVHAEIAAAVPLPGGPSQWLAQEILVDGHPAEGLLRDVGDTLWLALKPGTHQVVMQGATGQAENLSLSLPLKPHRVEAETDGWTIAGIGENGKPDGNLQLSRVVKTAAGKASLQEAELPSFVRVERTLSLGLRWEVHTRVTRTGSSKAPVFVAVPLLPGESVTGSEPRVEKGAAQVSLGPQSEETEWTGTLEMRPQLTLKSDKQDRYVETWRLRTGTQWHVDYAGIPVIHHQDSELQWSPEWQPWPGEEVRLTISKPAGVPGQVLTLDSSLMVVKPGLRTSDIELSLEIRSSRGGQHIIKLPAEAVLQGVSVDERSLPVRLEGAEKRELRLPLRPGKQAVKIDWHQPGGISAYFKVPEVDAGLPSVNARTEIRLPDDRWTLLLGGPRMGPAILVWGVAIAIALAAWGMRGVRLTPLRPRHWFLLGIGLTQIPVAVGALIVGWLFALDIRQKGVARLERGQFKFVQAVLAVWTAVALVSLAAAVSESLIGQPDMHIAGNESYGGMLRWYQDRCAGPLPQPWVVTLPMAVYRLLMLLWALWLAYALLGWLKWGWGCYSAGGYWPASEEYEGAAEEAGGEPEKDEGPVPEAGAEGNAQ